MTFSHEKESKRATNAFTTLQPSILSFPLGGYLYKNLIFGTSVDFFISDIHAFALQRCGFVNHLAFAWTAQLGGLTPYIYTHFCSQENERSFTRRSFDYGKKRIDQRRSDQMVFSCLD
jgi:hypothetical protein